MLYISWSISENGRVQTFGLEYFEIMKYQKNLNNWILFRTSKFFVGRIPYSPDFCWQIKKLIFVGLRYYKTKFFDSRETMEVPFLNGVS